MHGGVGHTSGMPGTAGRAPGLGLRSPATLKRTFSSLGEPSFRNLWIGFLLYIPVGLAVNCEFERLTSADCVGRERLGASYCSGMAMSGDANLTYLWDYTECVGTNTMRSASSLPHSSVASSCRGE